MRDRTEWPPFPFFGGRVPVELLVGREEERARLEALYRSGGAGAEVRGARGMGKTHLVRSFLAGKRHVFVDLHEYFDGVVATHPDDGWAALCRALVEELRVAGMVGPDVPWEGDLDFERYVLPSVARAGAPRLVIALDELDILDRQVVRRLVRSIRRGAEQCAVPPMLLAAAGRSWGADHLPGPLDPTGMLEPMPLGFLSPESIEDLLLHLEADGPFAFERSRDSTDGAARAIYEETCGYPLLTVAALEWVYEHRWERNDASTVTGFAIIEALESTRRTPPRIEHALSQAGPMVRRVLHKLADRTAVYTTARMLLSAVLSELPPVEAEQEPAPGATEQEAARGKTERSRAGMAAEAAMAEAEAALRALEAVNLVRLRGGSVLDDAYPELVAPLIGRIARRLPRHETWEGDAAPPPSAAAAYEAGRAHERDGRLTEAANAYDVARDAAPTWWPAHWAAGIVRLGLEQAERATDAFEDALLHLPRGSSLTGRVRRELCRAILMAGVDSWDRRRRLLELDPDLQLPGTRDAVTAAEVRDWWSEVVRGDTPGQVTRRTREMLDHPRRHAPMCDRTLDALRSDDAALAPKVFRCILPALLEVGAVGPDETLWPTLLDWIQRREQTWSIGSDAGEDARLWAQLWRVAPTQWLERLDAVAARLAADSFRRALEEGHGAAAAALADALEHRERTEALRRLLKERVLDLVTGPDDDGRLPDLLMGFGPALRAFVASGLQDTSDARDSAELLVGRIPDGTSIELDEACYESWSVLARRLEAPGLLTHLRVRATATADVDQADRERLRKILGDAYEIVARLPHPLASLPTVGGSGDPSGGRLRTYVAQDKNRDDERVLVREYVFDGCSREERHLIQSLWSTQNRLLKTVGRLPDATAIAQLRDSREHTGWRRSARHPARGEENGARAVAILEWPGHETLRARLLERQTCLRDGAAVGTLWRGLWKLINAVHLLWSHGFTVRTLRPEVLFWKEGSDDEPGDAVPCIAFLDRTLDIRSVVVPRSRDGRAGARASLPPPVVLDRYTAPEVLKAALDPDGGAAGGETLSQDLYALGLVLFEILVRPISREELGDFSRRGRYDPADHRRWLEDLRGEVKTAHRDGHLYDDEVQILLSLLALDHYDRPSDLLSTLERAQRLGLTRASTELGEGARSLVAFTTLRSDFADPREDPSCIAYYLRKRDVDLAQLPPDSLRPKALGRLLADELAGAKVYMNGSVSTVPSQGDFPLVIVTTSGLRLRAQELSVKTQEGFLSDEDYAYLQVATPSDVPAGPLLGMLTDKCTVLPLDAGEIRRQRRTRLRTEESWGALFKVARNERRRRDPSPEARPHEARLIEAIDLDVEVQREVFAEEVAYTSRQEGDRLVLTATDESVSLAECVIRWCEETLEIELARSSRTRPGRGEVRVVDPDQADMPSGTIALKYDPKLPKEGVVRPRSAIASEALYRRRRAVMDELRTDRYLQKILASAMPQGQVPRGTYEPERRLYRFDRARDVITPDLDDDKQEIVEHFMTSPPLTVVAGPPGTGKTTLAREIVLQVLAENRSGRVLVTTQSHEPLDNLVERLSVTLESSPRIRELCGFPEILRAASIHRPASTPTAERYAPANRADELAARMLRWAARRREEVGLGAVFARHLYAELEALTPEGEEVGRRLVAPASLRARLVEAASVFCCTTNSREIADAAPGSYDLVVVEEAARSYPIEIASAMRLARRWVLIGDHRQLPPFGQERCLDWARDTFDRRELELDALAASDEVLAAHLGPPREELQLQHEAYQRTVQLFASIHTGHEVHTGKEVPASPASTTLRTQWRMHPELAKVVSRVFYDEQAVCNPTRESDLEQLSARCSHNLRLALSAGRAGEDLLSGHSLVWVDFERDANIDREDGGRGRIHNTSERYTIVSFLRALRGRLAPEDVAILSPYRRQVEELKGLLATNSFEIFGPKVEPPRGELVDRVFTIDSYQGRQSRVVLLSLVRNNDAPRWQRGVGFLTDRRRGAVLCSRAECLLVIFGCSEHFRAFGEDGTQWLADLFDACGLVLPATEVRDPSVDDAIWRRKELTGELVDR